MGAPLSSGASQAARTAVPTALADSPAGAAGTSGAVAAASGSLQGPHPTALPARTRSW